jgi:hypothetical protein
MIINDITKLPTKHFAKSGGASSNASGEPFSTYLTTFGLKVCKMINQVQKITKKTIKRLVIYNVEYEVVVTDVENISYRLGDEGLSIFNKFFQINTKKFFYIFVFLRFLYCRVFYIFRIC